jgi:uncharacterized damage-inducible protein DinB
MHRLYSLFIHVKGSLMDNPQRSEPPLVGSERELLTTFLDYHRQTLLWKVNGLSDADLRRIMTPTGMSLLGLVKHLAYVERSWFQDDFAGEDVSLPWTKEDPNADFRIEPDETTEEILTLYKTEAERSRAIVAAASLDDIAHGPNSKPSLRWILVHMIEETARHNGHADLMREAIDGQTGE